MADQLSKDILEWLKNQDEFKPKDFETKFKIQKDELNEILKMLMIDGFIISPEEGCYMVSDKLKIFYASVRDNLTRKINDMVKGCENIQSVEPLSKIKWEDLFNIDKFIIYEGAEKYYEIKFHGKVVKLEGKEIIEPNVFRLRFYEEIGVLLPMKKGIYELWADLVSYWTKQYGEVSKDKVEVISESVEAKEMILDYINNSIITDDYVIKEGFITVRDDCIYVPVNIIKKLMKKEEIKLPLRKLCYILNDYILTGSIPLKVNNKSYRFWRLDLSKFNLCLDKKLEIQKEEDEIVQNA